LSESCGREGTPVLDEQRVNDLSPDTVIRSVAIASGMGASPAYSWLKIPVVDEMSLL